ncbi:D-glycerate dehydrogenase [Heliobacterium undosum]|uniref:D-glycerate dehydrogenase n=1 Tax=Heliomicrobium undosum TaxID=121734 RepID=A0A845L1C3_9FIRM|nr:2-hydroxyacid dehydrogenase family protein [Heliomicrobium undosum]MZP28769.1 D-glycerate dehydrogenase [Heliomicrobium undosum]
MKQKVFISGKIPAIAYEMLSQPFDVTMHDDLRLLSKEEILEGVKDKDALLALLSDNIDAEIIRAAPNLKVIANYGAGFNNIDVAAATARRIPVTNTPAVSTDATAELTWGLILSIARRIVEGDKNTRAGRFTGWAPLYHLGTEVTGKTLGIIGMGNIGKAVAKRAKGFDMKVIYYTRNRLSPELEREFNAEYLPLEDVLKQSDFLTFHVSYNPSMRHMIGARELHMMKPTAFLINAARGPLVEESALLEALRNKTIAGAALDVYEFEPKITPGLEQLDNVVLCPHLGNATVETRTAMAEIAAKNVIAVLKGDRALTPVNPQIYL